MHHFTTTPLTHFNHWTNFFIKFFFYIFNIFVSQKLMHTISKPFFAWCVFLLDFSRTLIFCFWINNGSDKYLLPSKALSTSIWSFIWFLNVNIEIDNDNLFPCVYNLLYVSFLMIIKRRKKKIRLTYWLIQMIESF